MSAVSLSKTMSAFRRAIEGDERRIAAGSALTLEDGVAVRAGQNPALSTVRRRNANSLSLSADRSNSGVPSSPDTFMAVSRARL